jgi:GH24 family phage-related lysozyme (muramidase)
MIAKADDIAKSINERPTALQGPGNVPVLVDRRTGTYQVGTERPADGTLAPRAAGPEMTPGQMAAADFLRTREGFRAAPYFDVNAHRAGFGSDTTTRADGSVVPVRQGMTVSREDAERDLARRIPQFEQRVVAAIGPEAYAAMPPNAQAALISIAYNYGSLPGRIRNAAMSGDPAALAKAVEGLAGDNRGINAGRRGAEAAMIAGAPSNAMAPPSAAPGNAMLAPQDATATGQPLMVPDFAQLAAPRTITEADRNRATMAVQQSQATARAAAEVQRETAPARAAEAGETTAAQTRAKLEAEEAVKRRQDAERLDTAIREVERIIQPGGLLQRATGSGAGALLDAAGNLVGMSSRAAEAARALPPITDLVLKMVPRFEGPQSERDVKVYENAAGDLSNPAIPNAQRLAAAREILRLMRDRRGQFSYEESRGGAPASPAPAPAPAGFSEGQTATGPNGQRIMFRGGQWVPMQ